MRAGWAAKQAEDSTNTRQRYASSGALWNQRCGRPIGLLLSPLRPADLENAKRVERLVIGGRILVGLDLDLVNHFLHVRNTLGERHGLFLLRGRFHAALQHQRSVLGVVRDTLVVEILVGLNGRFVVVLDGAIEVRVNRLKLALG